MKKFFFPLLYTLCILLTTSPIHAVSEFSTSFISTYVIKKDGTTHVTHNISIKNNLSHIYATSYTVSTFSQAIANVDAQDESGKISATTSSEAGSTTIFLQIDRPAIGKDQVKKLTLSYDTSDVVEILGNTISINIPRLSRANELESYTRIIKVQNQNHLNSLIYPPQTETHAEGDYTVYNFTGHQNSSLSLIFGDSVTYEIDLTYELKNRELTRGKTELALPPDTGYQKVQLERLDPAPLNLRVDQDGNWLASYDLAPQEKLLVKALLYVTVYPTATLYDPSQSEYQKTGHSKYWESNSQLIKDLSSQLKTPQNIYQYLVEQFTYNFQEDLSDVSRQGAAVALASPRNMLCTEFTDSFVALARSANIKAREINGYGFSNSLVNRPGSSIGDTLHAWPEYYDESQHKWISIDPTWGNTTGGINYFDKLDFSHITFVRHGAEDSYPLPAGAYKSNREEKYIHVRVAENVPEAKERLTKIDNVIQNVGTVAVFNAEVGYLPPYATITQSAPPTHSFYDKIKQLCAKLFSKFWEQWPASM